MANIEREGNEIVLKLSTGERIMAVHRNVSVPKAIHPSRRTKGRHGLPAFR